MQEVNRSNREVRTKPREVGWKEGEKALKLGEEGRMYEEIWLVERLLFSFTGHPHLDFVVVASDFCFLHCTVYGATTHSVTDRLL